MNQVKIVLQPQNSQKFFNNVAYFEAQEDQVDYCLGETEKDAGEICKKLLDFSISRKLGLGQMQRINA